MGYDLAGMKGALVLGLLVVSIQVLGAVAGKVTRPVPAIFVLGDSTLDVGNNNYLPGKDVPRANKPFHGIDLPGGPRATGRFSNGYNVADFVAKTLGFEKSPQAYLSLKARNCLVLDALLRGVSYASSGAGILDSTNAGKNIPLSKQVCYLESTKAEMEAKVGSAAVRRLFRRSFFLLGVGSNDLLQFVAAQLAQNKTTATQSEVAALFATLIADYSAAITDVYKMGARKLGIINVAPLGCVPRARLLNATGGCAGGINQLAAGFNAALESAVAGRLAPQLPGLAYSLADSFAVSQAAFADPRAAGFASVDSACCGSGRLGAEADCTGNSTLCGDRDGYVFWDAAHSTQRAAQLMAQAFYDDPAQFTAPVSFKQLACNKI